MKTTSSDFARKVPPLASLPKCSDCRKAFMPLIPTAARCFICERKAKRGGK